MGLPYISDYQGFIMDHNQLKKVGTMIKKLWCCVDHRTKMMAGRKGLAWNDAGWHYCFGVAFSMRCGV